jgi:hypothetical protein
MEIIAFLTGLLLFAAALLALPVDLYFSLEKDEKLTYRAELRWLFGLLSVDLSRVQGSEKKRRAPKRPGRGTTSRVGALLGNRALLRRVIQLIGELLRSFRIRELSLRGRIGTGDPADTGMLLGLLNPLLLNARHATLEADFEEAVFKGACSGEIRFVPIRAVGSVLAFLVSPVLLRSLFSGSART